jgi:hypothetical protein
MAVTTAVLVQPPSLHADALFAPSSSSAASSFIEILAENAQLAVLVNSSYWPYYV